MQKFVVVDTANLFNRARHATKGDAFTKAGSALHIAFMALRRLFVDHQATHLVVVGEGRSWRYDVYPEYKANRRLLKEIATPKDREETEAMEEAMDAFLTFMEEKTHATVLRSNGIEGDDFIARWVQLHYDAEHVILSSDSDFVQLLAPNVAIYDGMMERFIRHDGVFDNKGNPLAFSVVPGSGKIKVHGTLAEMAKEHRAKDREAKKANPDHVSTDYSFSIDPDWYRRALFVKLIRGDSGDGIFSAYPGVRYDGTKKSVGIRHAWEDRHERGYNWNNFMLQTWEKLVGVDANGEKIVKEVRVLDEYLRNESLIDLTKQPQHIKDRMDHAIAEALAKEPTTQIGVHFIRFCGEHNLPALREDAASHAAYLKKGYVL